MRHSIRTGVLGVLLVAFSALAADEPQVTVTGEVIDSACYLVEDGTGAVICIASVDDMETPNAKLRPFAGRRVTITGTWAERGGAKLLLLSSVKAAPAS